MHSFEEVLKEGVFIVDGEGDVNIHDPTPVHVAIAFQVEGYGPHLAVIYADQNPYHGSEEASLQAAMEILEEVILDRTDDAYLKELQDEWGDEWLDVLHENINGRAWTMSAKRLADAIKGTAAEKHIDVYEQE